MTRRKSAKTATAVLSIGLVSAFTIASLLVQSAITQLQSPLRELQQNFRALYIAETEQTLLEQRLLKRKRERGIAVAEEIFDPDSYAYLIIHYHKTGHDLSHQLRDFLVLAGRDIGGPVSNDRENTFQHRMHEENTGCPRAMELGPGIVHVQAAPNFFCDTNLLAEYLLKNGSSFREKRGVKVIHLVRNPFALAVSNWIYHTQFPTPELWVKTADPCTEELWYDHQDLAELVGPTLMSGDEPVMTREDFGALHDICTGIYRNSGEESKEWSYYTHLRHLDSRKALSLATTHMMIQGMSGGDILRMANNMIKLKQVQQLEDHIRVSQHMVPPEPHERMVQVTTLSMKEFTKEPYAATLRFLDFALENAVAPEVKERIAREYEQSYNDKLKSGNEHITADKEILNGKGQNIVKQKGSLEGFLRRHEVFGKVLGNIERLVNDSLMGSGSSVI